MGPGRCRRLPMAAALGRGLGLGIHCIYYALLGGYLFSNWGFEATLRGGGATGWLADLVSYKSSSRFGVPSKCWPLDLCRLSKIEQPDFLRKLKMLEFAVR